MTSAVPRSAARASVPANPVCVALDRPDRGWIDRVADEVAPHVGMFKVGLTTFIALGRNLVSDLAARRPVFLDLKLHDIPAQVAGAIDAASSAGATFVTVHAMGGSEMLRAAAEAAPPGLALLGVTVLTSIDETGLERLGVAGPVESAVLRLAELSLEAGVPGLVCSPLEVGAVRERFGAVDKGGPVLVVPGIRGAGSPADDQRRTLPAGEALALGADVIVVGRPITAAPDPGTAAASLAGEIA